MENLNKEIEKEPVAVEQKEYKIITTIGTEQIGKLITTPKGIRVKEKISAGTIAKAIKNDNNGRGIKLLFDHDKTKVLGSTLDGVLELSETKQGFNIVCNLKDNKEAYEAIKEKGNNGFSFGMTVLKDNIVNGVRSLDEIILSEVSVLLDLEPVYESETEFRADERERRNMKINTVGGTKIDIKSKEIKLDSCENPYEIVSQKINKNSIIAKCNKKSVPFGSVNFAVVQYENIEVFEVDRCLTIQGCGIENKFVNPLPIYGVDKFSKELDNLGIRADSKMVLNRLSDLVYIGMTKRLAFTLNDESVKVNTEIATTAKEKIEQLLKVMKSQYLIGSVLVLSEQDYQELIISKNSSGKSLIEIQGDKLIYDNMLEVEVLTDINNITIVNPTCIGQGSNTIAHCEEILTNNNARFGFLEYELLHNTNFVVTDALGVLQAA